jgi:glycosyltransferase involved in cell wall biosynthesis
MRIVHIDGGDRWGGGQNQIRLLMVHLGRRGIDQLCLCPAGSPLERRLLTEGLPVEGVPWEGGADLRVARSIFRHAKTATALHCHDGHALQLAVVPAWLRGKPIVATRRVHFPAKPRVWNRAFRIIAITEAVKKRLLECEIDEERICVIPSGIDIAEVRNLPPTAPGLRERLNIDRKAFVAGNVGNLFDFKNQKLIPRAAAHERNIMWVIVGDGPERGTIEGAIAAHGVTASVRMAGARTDARPYIREFDVFVFTSRGEALGTSILDAMALGIPVIAPDDAGPAEVLRPVHALTGATLYPPDDAAALAAAVRRARDDETLRRTMVEAQNVRLQDYHIENTAGEVIALYHTLPLRP